MSNVNEFWLMVAEEYLEREPEAQNEHRLNLAAALQYVAEQYMTGELPRVTANDTSKP